MKKLKSVIPIVIASTVQLGLLFPLVDSVPYVSSPAAMAILYSPDTKVPRTGEVALRKAIPANADMKAIQVALYIYLLYMDLNCSCRLNVLTCWMN